MVITVKEYTTKETNSYQECKYQQFKEYYFKTDLKINDILKYKLSLSNNCSTTRYIRKRMKEDRLNSDKRRGLIKKGEWI